MKRYSLNVTLNTDGEHVAIMIETPDGEFVKCEDVQQFADEVEQRLARIHDTIKSVEKVL